MRAFLICYSVFAFPSIVAVRTTKDSFITQDKNKHFEGTDKMRPLFQEVIASGKMSKKVDQMKDMYIISLLIPYEFM